MQAQRGILIAAVGLALAYAWLDGRFVGLAGRLGAAGSASTPVPARPGLESAVFAAGCFWCVEADFDTVPGVVATVSGYTGGHTPDPTYADVLRGGTGHAEAVQVVFDPAIVRYETLLAHFWRNVDPFVAHRQFCDVGEQYRPAIFVAGERQRRAAEASKAQLQARVQTPIQVAIVETARFHPAEAYHQDYARRHPLQYRVYRWRCGRDARLAQIQAITGSS